MYMIYICIYIYIYIHTHIAQTNTNVQQASYRRTSARRLSRPRSFEGPFLWIPRARLGRPPLVNEAQPWVDSPQTWTSAWKATVLSWRFSSDVSEMQGHFSVWRTLVSGARRARNRAEATNQIFEAMSRPCLCLSNASCPCTPLAVHLRTSAAGSLDSASSPNIHETRAPASRAVETHVRLRVRWVGIEGTIFDSGLNQCQVLTSRIGCGEPSWHKCSASVSDAGGVPTEAAAEFKRARVSRLGCVRNRWAEKHASVDAFIAPRRLLRRDRSDPQEATSGVNNNVSITSIIIITVTNQ